MKPIPPYIPNIREVIRRGDVPGLDLTPVFSNATNITIRSEYMRIGFGEVVTDEKNIIYHNAVVMPIGDAVAMANLILKLKAAREANDE